MKEIGSEFHYSQLNNGSGIQLPIENNSGVFVFSGRTAIEIVLQNEPTIKKALLPSYCCDSMIEPFRKTGIELCFYPVNNKDGLFIEFELPNDVDCVLWCNYFGFKNTMPDMSDFINRGGIILEDITHSFYSEQTAHKQSQYLVASLRKWEPILCGGYFESRKGSIQVEHLKVPEDSFIEKKKEAMVLKQRYLAGERDIDKSEFLHLYSESNEWLAKNYSGLSIDAYSKEYLKNVDFESRRNQRKRNARILYEGLKNYPDIEFLFPYEDMDLPLFVPVLIKAGKRDEIRKHLSENEIYCPVHWPKPNAACESNLYDCELSLICDQRYNEEDMQLIVDILCKTDKGGKKDE